MEILYCVVEYNRISICLMNVGCIIISKVGNVKVGIYYFVMVIKLKRRMISDVRRYVRGKL